jgi:hypothetical protein
LRESASRNRLIRNQARFAPAVPVRIPGEAGFIVQ